MERGSVLCRYFFQQMFLEDNCVSHSLQESTSSIVLSPYPTLSELRQKFPFQGSYHFRLQLSSQSSDCYYWQDLIRPNQLLPVASNGEIYIKVLQLHSTPESEEKEEAEEKKKTNATMTEHELVDVPEDQQFRSFFHWQNQSQDEGSMGYPMPQPQVYMKDMSAVIHGVKKVMLASRLKSSAMAQTLQKHSAQMWEKVTAAASGSSGGVNNAAPNALTLAQLAKLMVAMKTPLHPGNDEHVEMLQRLWTSCFESQPFHVINSEWNRLGFRHGDPMRELQVLLPLQCLVFFHDVHRTVALPILNDVNGPTVYSYALVGSQIVHLLADLLQLRDGGCLGLERPFWKLFEDPIAFYELFFIAFRAFDLSWKLNSSNTTDVHFYLNYIRDFVQELLCRGPENILNLIELAHQLQNW